jgi:hypothetical protein
MISFYTHFFALSLLHVNMGTREGQYNADACRPVEEGNALSGHGSPPEVAAVKNDAFISTSPVSAAWDLHQLLQASNRLNVAMHNFQVCMENWLRHSIKEPSGCDDEPRMYGSPVYGYDPNDLPPTSPDYSNIGSLQ